MKKPVAGLLALALASSALAPLSAAAASPAPAPAAALDNVAQVEPASGFGLSAAVGLGALAGVVGFNLLALGVGALPGGLAYGAGALVVPAEMSVAMSRVYATGSAVAGALTADYIYTNGDIVGHKNEAAHSWVNPRLLSAGAGAITGIVGFNVLTGGLGAVPFAGGALAAVPTDVALGSRFLAGVSGGAGGLLGAYAHDAYTGEKHDTGYMLALTAGALGGIAAGNLLVGWAGGLPLSAAATTEASVAGTFTSAAGQAASRVYVVASGVLGAWAADALYGVR